MSRFNNGRETIEVEATAQVSLEDIRTQVDFCDIMDAYNVDAKEVCENLDAGEVIEWVIGQRLFRDSIEEIMERVDGFLAAAILHIKASPSLLRELQAPKPVFEHVTNPTGLYSTVTVNGVLHATIMPCGAETHVSCVRAEGAMLRFTCESETVALEILTALLTVQS